MMKQSRVIIFSTVWPEPDSSAAGVRQMQWVQLFLGMGYAVTLVSPAREKNEDDWGSIELPDGVEAMVLPLNRESIQDDLARIAPDVVLFDRFFLEEQYGHHVFQSCPNALVLLETQDLHFVRRARDEFKEEFLSTAALPRDFYHTESALRETSAILRVDHSFVVSSFEERLLREEFGIGSGKVKWVPFFYDRPIAVKESRRPFSEKRDFCWIGNFRHEPNIDGLRWFRKEIWPLIRAQLPDAKIRVYGAYPPKEVMEWNNARNGFEVKGSALTLEEVFEDARVNLAPLRFGAGVKGKIMEGFRFGVPCVTTKVGVEGLFVQFPGAEANTPIDFAKACVRLHESEAEWKKFSLMALEKMMEVCAASSRVPELRKLIEDLLARKRSGELPDWTSRVMRFEGNQSRLYFARWIEEKERRIALQSK
jgi:glycosyltransferase involved in cell wall biosynthesis